MVRERHIIDIFCSASVYEKNNIETLLIPSLKKMKGNNSLRLHLVDYTGTNKLKAPQNSKIKIFVHKNNKQLGFGAAHNFLFDKVKPKNFFLIINPDVYVNESFLENLINSTLKNENIGIVEGRQLPYEHPKGYDQDTLETNWASGACIFVSSKFYQEVGGFDEAFWMYCEDVDLSWRCWLAGYSVIHCPVAVAYHYTGGFFEYRDDRYYYEQIWSGVNYLYLSYKYWGHLRLFWSKIVLSRQNIPKMIKNTILNEFKARKRGYKRAKNFKVSLFSLRNKIGIVGYNRYR